MKKVVIVTAIIIAILSLGKDTVVIPKDSIRFRIIANSDTEIDQSLKRKIIKNIWQELIVNKNNIEEARNYIKDNMPLLENKISETLKENNNDTNFEVKYGPNYFPRKEYKGVIYEEGEYESLVVKLGEGKGHNFWCVLFPPLCLIDEDENTEYKSLIKEVINKFK